jgi:hypothetical protein
MLCPGALELNEIPEIVEDFRIGAKNAKHAGFEASRSMAPTDIYSTNFSVQPAIVGTMVMGDPSKIARGSCLR